MFLYHIKEDNTISIYRAFGSDGIVDIPAILDGLQVTEIADYCFAAKSKYEIDTTKIPDNLHVQAGKFIESVTLPDTIIKIGKNAFYNCGKLKEINFPGIIAEIGGDIFMNCNNLSQIKLRCDLRNRTCLKQILSQISWNVEVEFEDEKTEAVLFYPEYFERYDEIGPAHIFELNIRGEGFRTRQCFHEGIFRFDEYDDIFPQACAEEPVKNLVKIAMNRVVYPFDLSIENKDMYVSFLRNHTDDIVKIIFKDKVSKEKRLHYIYEMAKSDCFGVNDINKMIERASLDGLVELSVSLLKIKSELFNCDTQNRYSFEDF